MLRVKILIHRICCLVILFLIPASERVVQAANLMDPPVFSSKAGVLSLTLIAREQLTNFAAFHAKTWVYEVCERPAGISSNVCPAGSVAGYGGVRLRLQSGDKLKIRLVNKLPPAPADAKHAQDAPAMLGGNPTNLHTHGLIVEPRRAGNGLTSFGDYVFVLTYNSKNGPIPPQHEGMDVQKDFTDYEIDIPKEHPSGLFWFHPHAHGLALNQVSAGLAGVITIGKPADYLCDQPGCSGYSGKIPVRHMILKDTQILASGDLLTQQDTQFCAAPPGTDPPAGNGFCAGQRRQDDSGGVIDRTGGQWFFTVNGQVFPSIAVKAGTGEIWRITNASGGATYELGLTGADGYEMVVQILSVDGVSIVTPQNGAGGSMEKLLAERIETAPCASLESEPMTYINAPPLCAKRIQMMPSSRVEIWMTYRDAAGAIASPPQGATAVLRTYGFNTGWQGDSWPAVPLAQVQFDPLPPKTSPPVTSLGVRGQALSAMLPGGIFAAPPSIKVRGVTNSVSVESLQKLTDMKMGLADPRAPYVMGSAAAVAEMRKLPPAGLSALEARVSAATDLPCPALAQNHTRRIFFGVPTGNPDAFGMGYEELDEKGVPMPGSFRDIAPFDHAKVDICLPLGPGNKGVTEHWELVNVAGEDHNFHIHQTKFQVAPEGASNTSIEPARGAVQLDNVPVPTNKAQEKGSCDGSIQRWRDGICKPVPVEVLIPFTQVGDFVFHCHILEHEDGGMMAKIRVIPH
jgi:L-ascorbate oxidase